MPCSSVGGLLGDHRLANQYTVFVSLADSPVETNACILNMLNVSFPGNIVIVRQGARKTHVATQMPYNERCLVDMIILR